MDLIGPSRVESLWGKKYILVAVDDFSKLTWVHFLKEKSDTFVAFKALCLRLQIERGCKIENIVCICSDQGREFENSKFSNFCDE